MATATQSALPTRRYETGSLRYIEGQNGWHLYANRLYDEVVRVEDWTEEQIAELHDEDPVYYFFQPYYDLEGWYCVWAWGPTAELARTYAEQNYIELGRDFASLPSRWIEYRNQSLLQAIDHCISRAQTASGRMV